MPKPLNCKQATRIIRPKHETELPATGLSCKQDICYLIAALVETDPILMKYEIISIPR